MKPTIGRIVQYTLTDNDVEAHQIRSSNVKAGDTCAAVIVRTWGDTPESAVNLRVFIDGPKDIWVTSRTVAPNGEVYVAGHWNWPERT